MKLHLACYAALDIIEEKLNERRQSSTQIATTASATPSTAIAKDPFLGMLMPVDEYKVYVRKYYPWEYVECSSILCIEGRLCIRSRDGYTPEGNKCKKTVEIR